MTNIQQDNGKCNRGERSKNCSWFAAPGYWYLSVEYGVPYNFRTQGQRILDWGFSLVFRIIRSSAFYFILLYLQREQIC